MRLSLLHRGRLWFPLFLALLLLSRLLLLRRLLLRRLLLLLLLLGRAGTLVLLRLSLLYR